MLPSARFNSWVSHWSLWSALNWLVKSRTRVFSHSSYFFPCYILSWYSSTSCWETVILSSGNWSETCPLSETTELNQASSYPFSQCLLPSTSSKWALPYLSYYHSLSSCPPPSPPSLPLSLFGWGVWTLSWNGYYLSAAKTFLVKSLMHLGWACESRMLA